jgi:hypothetical protein
MSEPRVRVRNPFKFDTEIPEIDQDVPDRVLDEQGTFDQVGLPTGTHVYSSCINTDSKVVTFAYIEQEHIVEELQKENIRLEAKYTRFGAIILCVSMLL